MLLQNRVSLIMSALNGQVFTDDSKIEQRAIQGEFAKWRQKALLIAWNGSGPFAGFPSGVKGNKFLNPKNYLSTDLTYDPSIQVSGASFILFEVEPPVNLDERANGCMFCGDQDTGQTFIPLKTPNSYSVFNDAGIINSNKVYYNITGNLLKVWGNLQLRTIHLDYLPLDPLNVTDFNPATDDYPVGEDVWDIMKSIAVYELTPSSLRPGDALNDAAQSQERASRG